MPEIKIDETKCKGCSLCVINCPKKCIEMSDSFGVTGYYPAKFVRPADCIGCGMCAQICPDLAIGVYKETAKKGG
jgi:2-oxoglutarate ferredoxin oxidoreductase subunit delta